MSLTRLIVEIIGWTGAICVLTAYFLVSSNRVRGDSVGYQVLNLAGAIFLIIHTIYMRVFPSTLVNIVWIAIAVVTLFRIWHRRVRRPGSKSPSARSP